MSNLEITKERIYDELKDLSNSEIKLILESLIGKFIIDKKLE